MSEQTTAVAKRKIFVFCNSHDVPGKWHVMIAVAEDGPCVASHVCSDHCFAEHDMGFTSDWKHKSYNEHFGPGNWELEWVEREDVKAHEGVQAALVLNRKLAEAAKAQGVAA